MWSRLNKYEYILVILIKLKIVYNIWYDKMLEMIKREDFEKPIVNTFVDK